MSCNSGIDAGGKDLPKELLEYLYTSMVTNEIKMLQGMAPSATTEKSKGAVMRTMPCQKNDWLCD